MTHFLGWLTGVRVFGQQIDVGLAINGQFLLDVLMVYSQKYFALRINKIGEKYLL